MDLSLRRVLEAFLPGPATPRILVSRYGMEVEESEMALAAAIDEGLVEPCGPVAFRLTREGVDAAHAELRTVARDRALVTEQQLSRRDRLLLRFDR